MPPTSQQKPDDKAAAEQARIDKEAADLAAQQAEADKLAADAQAAALRAAALDEPAGPRCPTCSSDMEFYEGSNPHKVGSYVCPVHGRVRL